MTRYEHEGYYDELCLHNPYSRISLWIHWFYNDINSDWFATDYNKAIHDLDASKIYKFGAFARAQDEAIHWNEYNRDEEDKLKNGKQLKKDIDCAYWNLSKVFLLWWGNKMNTDEVNMLSTNTYE